jgi:hypothetical protein
MTVRETKHLRQVHGSFLASAPHRAPPEETSVDARILRSMPGVGQIALPFDGDPSLPEVRSNSTAFVDNMVLPVHRWFRYSAGFSAEWAQKVIRDVGASRVVDPFAGSGTSLLAAESENAESIGVDAHPFVAKVACAKLAWRSDPDEVLDLARWPTSVDQRV